MLSEVGGKLFLIANNCDLQDDNKTLSLDVNDFPDFAPGVLSRSLLMHLEK